MKLLPDGLRVAFGHSRYNDRERFGPLHGCQIEVVHLRADEELQATLATGDAMVDGKITAGTVLARVRGELAQVPPEDVQYADISAKQIVGVSAALIRAT